MFNPRCGDIIEWHDAKARPIRRNDFSGEVAMKKVAAAGLGAVGIAGAVALFLAGRGGSAGVAKGAMSAAENMWKQAHPDYYRQRALEALFIDKEARLDRRCTDLAMEALRDA